MKLTLDPGAAALLDALHAAGYAAYAVGGCVRDSLLGRTAHDWDLCTSALPQQVMELFGTEQCIPTGLQHGTVTIKYGGQLYETTTFRTEGSYTDGRHPDEVQFVPDVREDLARRDFTINAMAYNAAEGLVDPFGGQKDLQNGLLRAVGEPQQRFTEDALRPFASGFVEVNVVDKTVRPAMGIDSTNLSVKDYFAQNPGRETEFCTLTYNGMGIYESTSEQMADEAVAYAKENNAELIDAVVEVLCRRISYVGGFILAFVMILILLTVIGNIPNISFQIPNHELLNDIGGAVAGLVQGMAFCLIIGWALRFVGLLVSQETLSNTFLVSWFMDRTIFVHLLGI